MTEQVKALFCDEVRVLQAINHPNVIKCMKLEKTHDDYYLALEYCNGGTLESLKKKF